MKKARIFLLFLCVIVFFSSITSQTTIVEANSEGGGLTKFKITNPELQKENQPKYSNSPYHQAFIIYGDGNFERIGILGNPIYDGIEFEYQYRNITSGYPGSILFISRKDDNNPPPPPDELIIPTTNGNSYIDILEDLNANGNFISDLSLVPEDRSIAITLSHHHISSLNTEDANGEVTSAETYFLQEDRIHIVPIAYKPSAEGILLFFCSKPIDGISYNPIEHIYEDGFTTGTIIPNYDPSNDPPPLQISKQKVTAISEFSNQAITFSTNDVKCFSHIIDSDEVQKLANAGGELRLFHFIKTEGIFPIANEKATLLAVLYEMIEAPDNERLDSLNSDAAKSFNTGPKGTNTIFPATLTTDLQTYQFSDYSLLKAQKGEPDDPGGLNIINIEKSGFNYTLTFNLEFCNSSNATAEAVSFNIFLRSRHDEASNDLLTDIELISDCPFPTTNSLPPGSLGDCEEIANFNGDSYVMNDPSDLPDEKYGFDILTNGIEIDGLTADECANIQFTAKIKSSEIHRITKEAVMDYCVKFLSKDSDSGTPDETIDVGEFCQPNSVPKEKICKDYIAGNYYPVDLNNPATYQIHSGSNKQRIICYPNPLLPIPGDDKNLWLWCCCLFCIILFAIIFYFFRRKHKYPK